MKNININNSFNDSVENNITFSHSNEQTKTIDLQYRFTFQSLVQFNRIMSFDWLKFRKTLDVSLNSNQEQIFNFIGHFKDYIDKLSHFVQINSDILYQYDMKSKKINLIIEENQIIKDSKASSFLGDTLKNNKEIQKLRSQINNHLSQKDNIQTRHNESYNQNDSQLANQKDNIQTRHNENYNQNDSQYANHNDSQQANQNEIINQNDSIQSNQNKSLHLDSLLQKQNETYNLNNYIKSKQNEYMKKDEKFSYEKIESNRILKENFNNKNKNYNDTLNSSLIDSKFSQNQKQNIKRPDNSQISNSPQRLKYSFMNHKLEKNRSHDENTSANFITKINQKYANNQSQNFSISPNPKYSLSQTNSLDINDQKKIKKDSILIQENYQENTQENDKSNRHTQSFQENNNKDEKDKDKFNIYMSPNSKLDDIRNRIQSYNDMYASKTEEDESKRLNPIINSSIYRKNSNHINDLLTKYNQYTNNNDSDKRIERNINEQNNSNLEQNNIDKNKTSLQMENNNNQCQTPARVENNDLESYLDKSDDRNKMKKNQQSKSISNFNKGGGKNKSKDNCFTFNENSQPNSKMQKSVNLNNKNRFKDNSTNNSMNEKSPSTNIDEKINKKYYRNISNIYEAKSDKKQTDRNQSFQENRSPNEVRNKFNQIQQPKFKPNIQLTVTNHQSNNNELKIKSHIENKIHNSYNTNDSSNQLDYSDLKKSIKNEILRELRGESLRNNYDSTSDQEPSKNNMDDKQKYTPVNNSEYISNITDQNQPEPSNRSQISNLDGQNVFKEGQFSKFSDQTPVRSKQNTNENQNNKSEMYSFGRNEDDSDNISNANNNNKIKSKPPHIDFGINLEKVNNKINSKDQNMIHGNTSPKEIYGIFNKYIENNDINTIVKERRKDENNQDYIFQLSNDSQAYNNLMNDEVRLDEVISALNK